MNPSTYKALKSPSSQHNTGPGQTKNNVKIHIGNVSMTHIKTEKKVTIDASQLEKTDTKINKHVFVLSNKLILLIVVAFVLFFSIYTKHKVNEYNKMKDLNNMLMKVKSMFVSLYEMDEKVAKGIQHVENSYNVYQNSFSYNEMTEPQTNT